MSQWQPIETAPKDGSYVILTNGEDVTAGWWRGRGSGWNTGYEALDFTGEPTHWMSMPDPPEKTQ